MKKLLAALLLVLLIPACALALDMQKDGNYLILPEWDNMKSFFRDLDEWTIVTRDNYEEHMDLMLRRGGTEEDIRARFAEESLIYEAYWDGLPEDACVRLECFEDAYSRDIWNIKTLSTKRRSQLVEDVGDGKALANYETFSCKRISGSGSRQWLECSFTTWPPAAHESGVMRIGYINGRAYVITYSVYGRMAGREKLRSHKENNLIEYETPILGGFSRIKPDAYLPKLTAFALDDIFPMQVELGELTVKGDIAKGGKLTVTVDGEPVKCSVKSSGAFTATLPLNEPGEHEVVFTATHSKYTDRVETFAVHASGNRTPLKMTELPEDYVTAGEQTITGESAPGAVITIELDDEAPVTLTADEAGAFSHTFESWGDQLHLLTITAHQDGRDDSAMQTLFVTEYETFKDGVKAFEKKLTKESVAAMAENPAAYKGERVKISVVIKEVRYAEEGLGILCTYNPPKGSKQAKTPLYLTFYGYGEDQLQKGMITTIYGTVQGTRIVDGEERMDILVQYGTYLVNVK